MNVSLPVSVSVAVPEVNEVSNSLYAVKLISGFPEVSLTLLIARAGRRNTARSNAVSVREATLAVVIRSALPFAYPPPPLPVAVYPIDLI